MSKLKQNSWFVVRKIPIFLPRGKLDLTEATNFTEAAVASVASRVATALHAG